MSGKRKERDGSLLTLCSNVNIRESDSTKNIIRNRLYEYETDMTWKDILNELLDEIPGTSIGKADTVAVALTPKLNSNISECFYPDIDETISVVKEFDDRLKYATFEIEKFSCQPAAKETTNPPPTVNAFNRLMP